MNKDRISVKMTYSPVKNIKYTESDLKKISDEIIKKEEFAVEPFESFVKVYDSDEEINAEIYFNNTINYSKRGLNKEDFTPDQLKSIAKEGLKFAQENTPTKDYTKIEISVFGINMNDFYHNKAKFVIEEFSKELFGECAKCTEDCLNETYFHVSIKSTEVPVLEISD